MFALHSNALPTLSLAKRAAGDFMPHRGKKDYEMMESTLPIGGTEEVGILFYQFRFVSTNRNIIESCHAMYILQEQATQEDNSIGTGEQVPIYIIKKIFSIIVQHHNLCIIYFSRTHGRRN